MTFKDDRSILNDSYYFILPIFVISFMRYGDLLVENCAFLTQFEYFKSYLESRMFSIGDTYNV